MSTVEASPALGRIENEPITQYHQADAFSNSKLKDFDRLPSLYHGRYIAKTIPRRQQTKALSIGTAVDLMLLEGVHAYHSKIAVTPDTYINAKGETKPWHNGAGVCDAWNTKAEASGRVVISPTDATQVEEMCGAAYRDPDIAALLEHGRPGVTWRADFGFAFGQCRTDWVNEEGCVLPSTGEHTGPYFLELKSCRSLISTDYGAFEKDFANMGYHKQLALYREIIRQVAIDQGESRSMGYLRPFFIVVDKVEIPQAAVFAPSQRMLELSHKAVERTLERLAECYESGVWPGIPTGVRTLDLPIWEQKKLESVA